MVRNYLLSALRFIKHNKVFAIINLTGLSIALAASFLILLYVINELSYNTIHKNRRNVYRVLNYYSDFKQTMAGTPYVLASTLKDEFPQVRAACNTRPISISLKFKDEYVRVMAMSSSSDIFRIFSIPLIEGQSEDLDAAGTILISRDMAERYFPGTDPVGREILSTFNNSDIFFTVTGVFENIPANSTLQAQCFISNKYTLDPINKTFNVKNADINWTFDFWNTWVLLSEDAKPADIEKQFEEFGKRHISENPHNSYSLQGLGDVYLRSANVANTGKSGNIRNIRLFSLIAFLIVLVAAINYIILSTAVSVSRTREIGIRKAFGAAKNNIRTQMMSESLILVIIVLPFAILLSRVSMPVAGKLFQTRLEIMISNIPVYILVYLFVALIIGLISGIYTSSYLSSLNVMDVFRNSIHAGKNKQWIRASLIVVQLVIFSTFVSSTLIIRSQYDYALKKDTGHYKQDVLLLELGRDFKGYPSFINNLKSNPNVIMAAGVMNGLPMMGSMSTMHPGFENPETKVKVEGLAVDYHFINTMGIPVLQGREFSEEFGSDLTQSVMLNETAVNALGIKEPVGKQLGGRNIIGIVRDFNLHSIHSDIPPVEIHMTDKYIQQVAVHYKPGTLKNVLPFIETEWKKVAPDRQFIYSPIESLIENLYSSEKNLSTIVSIFAVFTLLIATLGLFGLILFISKSRIKETGIKKVFGSSENAIVISYLSSNIRLVISATCISIPLTLYFMMRWLNNFPFHTSISAWIFLIAFIVSTVVVTATVFFHSYKASMINPVDALKNE